MALRKLLIASALVLTACAAAPAKASADWLFTPYLGMNWGGTAGFTDSLGDFEDEFEQKMNFGASLSWMGAGALGFEADFARRSRAPKAVGLHARVGPPRIVIRCSGCN